jgi:putative inorganic carbon (hco3(-)) transporter
MRILSANTREGQSFIGLMACMVIAVAWYFVPHPAVAVLGFLPALFVGTLRVPFVLSLLFIIFSFFRIHEAYTFLYPLKIPSMLAIACFGVLTWSFLTRQISPYWSPLLTAFATFFVIVTLQTPFAQNVGTAIGYWNATYVKIGAMVLAVCWLTRQPKDFILATRMFVIAGILVGMVAIYNKHAGIGLVEGTRVTISRELDSLLGDPNDLSLVMSFPASFALALATTREAGKKTQWLGVIGYCVAFYAVICTQSRGGLMGICAATGIVGWFRIQNKMILVGIMVVAALILPVAAGISSRSSGGAAEEGIDESAMGRIYAWQAAINMSLAHPIRGVGLNNFVPNYYAYSPHWDGKNHAVHSTWFGVLGETGWVGLIAFVTMVVVTVKTALRSANLLQKPDVDGNYVPEARIMSLATAAGIFGFLASGTFLTMGFVWPIYILLSLTVSVEYFARGFRPHPSVRKEDRFTKKATDQALAPSQ